MTDNIVTDVTNVNLDEELAAIRCACAAADAAGAAADAAGRDRIEHAIEAGWHFIIVRDHVGRGFRAWLKKHGFKKSAAYNYILLAENAESFQSSGHSSIAAALRMLRPKSGKSKKPGKCKSSTGSSLKKAIWTKATHDERQRFLDAVGVDAMLATISFTFRTELKRRVAGQKAASANADKFDEKSAKLLRHALSQQKNAKIKDTIAPEVISVLNSLNSLITNSGRDLHEIFGLKFDRSQTINKPATAKAAA